MTIFMVYNHYFVLWSINFQQLIKNVLNIVLSKPVHLLNNFSYFNTLCALRIHTCCRCVALKRCGVSLGRFRVSGPDYFNKHCGPKISGVEGPYTCRDWLKALISMGIFPKEMYISHLSLIWISGK